MKVFVPDLNELGWRAVRFQPMLLTTMFVAGVILCFERTADQHLGLPLWLWVTLLIATPPIGLAGAGMAMHSSHNVRAWGFGLRIMADIWAAIALGFYIVSRLEVETYVMSGAVLVAVGWFCLAILFRDYREWSAEYRVVAQKGSE